MKIYRNSYQTFDGHQGYTYHASKDAADQNRRTWLTDFKIKNDEKTKEMIEKGIQDPDKYVDYYDAEVETTSDSFPLDKAGMLDALNSWGSHPDNG